MGQEREKFERYGIEWPAGTNDATVELGCYRIGGTVQHEAAWHLERAVKLLWPSPVYEFNYWTSRRIKAWCENDWLTVWGASSTGKSTDFGMLSVAHWLSAPFSTTITVCSTSKGALMKRIWCEVLKFYGYLKDAPGRYYPGRTAILYPQTMGGVIGSGDFDEESNAIKYSRNGIFGVAVQKGSVQEAFSDLIGVHNLYNAIILDEMQAVREAAVEAVANLQGGLEFKFVGMGNPDSRLDLLGKYSKPKSGKWSDATPEMDEWETERGKCIFFDGRKSPAIVEPNGAKRFPFLLKSSDIEQRRKWFGENSRKFWGQTIGFIPPEDADQTVFTETFIIYNEMDQKAVFDGNYEMVAGIDWAFTEGGDRCIIKPAKVGLVNGVKVLEFQETEVVTIDVVEGEPTAYVTARKAKDVCKRLGLTPELVGVDSSGTQGPQADIFEQVWMKGVLRVGFGGGASDRLIETENGKRAKEVYQNRMTELWYQMYDLGRGKQVRGVNTSLALELVSRKLKQAQPLQLEPKRLMKARVGYSPDEADAAVICVEVAIQRCGLSVVTLGGEAVVGDYMGMARDTNYDGEQAYAVNMEAAYG